MMGHDDVDHEDEVLSQYLQLMYIVFWIFGFPDFIISWHLMKADCCGKTKAMVLNLNVCYSISWQHTFHR